MIWAIYYDRLSRFPRFKVDVKNRKKTSLILDTVIMIHVCLGSFIYRATKEEEKAAIGKFD